MTVKVVSVREADGGGAVILTFEISAEGTGGESERRSLLLTLPQYREHRLRRGDTVTTEEFDELETMSKTAEATRRGAGHTRIRRKFAQHPAAQADKQGLFARRIRCGSRRALGRRAYRRKKGRSARGGTVRGCAARQKIYIGTAFFARLPRRRDRGSGRIYEKRRFSRTLRAIYRKKYGGALPDEPRERDRAVAALMRRGFSGSDIREATRKLGSHK